MCIQTTVPTAVDGCKQDCHLVKLVNQTEQQHTSVRMARLQLLYLHTLMHIDSAFLSPSQLLNSVWTWTTVCLIYLDDWQMYKTSLTVDMYIGTLDKVEVYLSSTLWNSNFHSCVLMDPNCDCGHLLFLTSVTLAVVSVSKLNTILVVSVRYYW